MDLSISTSDKVRSRIRDLPAYIRVCMVSTLLWGILAHGIALVTKFSMADEAHYLFSVGATATSGRWFLGVLGAIVRWVFGSPNFSLPLWSGLATLFFTGLCSCVLVWWLELNHKWAWVLASGLLTVFPVMSGLFFYNFTAPYYMFGLLLVLWGGALLRNRRSAASFVLAVCLVCLGLSIYQAFLSLFLSLLLVSFFQTLSDGENRTFSVLFQEIARYLLGCIVIAALYLLTVKLSVSLVGEGLSDYKGISTMGAADLGQYIQRVKLAIYLFLFPARSDRYAFLLPYRLLDCYYVVLALIAFWGGWQVIRLFRHSPVQAITALLALAFFPLAVNFIYVVCNQEDVYNLMLFGQLAPFLLLLCLLDRQTSPKKPVFWVQRASAGLLLVFCLFCARVDNAVYTRGQLIQTRSISYFTSLVTAIRSAPGYTGSTPVAFVGDPSYAMDPTFHSIEGFGALSMAPLPYDASPFSIGYSWQDFLTLWCGFTPPYADGEDFADLPEVQAMPGYPDNGSVRMVAGTVVVKLNTSKP